jgi:hypothetical protein
MRYINEIVWGPIEPKWFGCYELELHNVIAEAATKQYHTIIDIGSAEGYYSVGFALNFSDAGVFSFEIDPWARGQQRRLADLNRVSNLTIRGFCTHKDIDAISCGRTLVICDIEGSEKELLDPSRALSLRASDCVVELHDTADFSMSEMVDLFIERFKFTHSIRLIEMEERVPVQLESSGTLPGEVDASLLDEHRSQRQVWLWMQARRLLQAR